MALTLLVVSWIPMKTSLSKLNNWSSGQHSINYINRNIRILLWNCHNYSKTRSRIYLTVDILTYIYSVGTNRNTHTQHYPPKAICILIQNINASVVLSELPQWRSVMLVNYDYVIKWKHFPRNWPFDSPHKSQWRGAFMFSLICVWINDWVNTREAGNLRRYHAHYDVIVMTIGKVYPGSG